MKSKDYSLEVFVNGKPVHEYEHNGNTFIEGRKSSSFEIEFRNHTSGRVLVVPSVDGLSTLNGNPATAESPGYVVKAHDTLRIKGWTVDGGNVAQFVFKDKEGSYARGVTGASAQAGVVGVIVYREKVETVPVPPVFVIQPIQSPPFAPPYKPWVSPGVYPLGGPLTGQPYLGGAGLGVCHQADINRVFHNAAPTNLDHNIALDMVAKGSGVLQDSTSYSGENSRRVQMSMSTQATASLNAASTSAPFELGTGWGDRVEMKTSQVTFNRGELDHTLALYYDSRRNLEKRGIEVLKREPRVSNELPQAFTGIGCKPPPGWN